MRLKSNIITYRLQKEILVVSKKKKKKNKNLTAVATECFCAMHRPHLPRIRQFLLHPVAAHLFLFPNRYTCRTRKRPTMLFGSNCWKNRIHLLHSFIHAFISSTSHSSYSHIQPIYGHRYCNVIQHTQGYMHCNVLKSFIVTGSCRENRKKGRFSRNTLLFCTITVDQIAYFDAGARTEINRHILVI